MDVPLQAGRVFRHRFKNDFAKSFAGGSTSVNVIRRSASVLRYGRSYSSIVVISQNASLAPRTPVHRWYAPGAHVDIRLYVYTHMSL